MSITRKQFEKRTLVPVQDADIDWPAKAMRVLELNRREESLKSERRGLNHSMKKIIGARNQLIDEMQNSSVYQDILCHELINYGNAPEVVEDLGISVPPTSMMIVRMDTKEVLESRKLTDDDMQEDLPLGRKDEEEVESDEDEVEDEEGAEIEDDDEDEDEDDDIDAEEAA
jgi:hypothetical protein